MKTYEMKADQLESMKAFEGGQIKKIYETAHNCKEIEFEDGRILRLEAEFDCNEEGNTIPAIIPYQLRTN